MTSTQIAEAVFWCIGVPGLIGLGAYAWFAWKEARR